MCFMLTNVTPPKGVKLNENEDTFYYKTHRNRYFCIK